jgi:DMSO/TMAO reductase YedYZ molybdopterin-dependent catalytic subunit
MLEPESRAAPLHALDGLPTPVESHFRRNHYAYPDVDGGSWAIAVTGAVEQPFALSLVDLKRFPRGSRHVVLECAGHRRTELDPPVEGLPWGAGAVSQGLWTGATLASVLAHAAPVSDATEVVLVGSDGEGEDHFARSIPIAKARDDATLLAWELNGAEVAAALGGPLRAIVPGYYAVDSVKWLRRIVVATEPFGGHYQVNDYCLVGADGIADGTQLHELPVSSLVTATGPTRIAGVAWGGEIARLDVEIDDGTGIPATLGNALGPFAFVPWELAVELSPGRHTAAARATDAFGNTQPDWPLWNAGGYANSSVHRVVFTVS